MEQDLNNWFTFLALALSCTALWTGVVNRREDQRLDAIETLARIEKKRSSSRKLFTQARRRAQTVLEYPGLELLGGLRDVATDWLAVAVEIETNHDELGEEVALVRDSLHKRRRFDLVKLKVLESSLDSLLELNQQFSPGQSFIGPTFQRTYSL